jgi:hypothetical protein
VPPASAPPRPQPPSPAVGVARADLRNGYPAPTKRTSIRSRCRQGRTTSGAVAITERAIHCNALFTLKVREKFTQRAPADEARAVKAPSVGAAGLPARRRRPALPTSPHRLAPRRVVDWRKTRAGHEGSPQF